MQEKITDALRKKLRDALRANLEPIDKWTPELQFQSQHRGFSVLRRGRRMAYKFSWYSIRLHNSDCKEGRLSNARMD